MIKLYLKSLGRIFSNFKDDSLRGNILVRFLVIGLGFLIFGIYHFRFRGR